MLAGKGVSLIFWHLRRRKVEDLVGRGFSSSNDQKKIEAPESN